MYFLVCLLFIYEMKHIRLSYTKHFRNIHLDIGKREDRVRIYVQPDKFLEAVAN